MQIHGADLDSPVDFVVLWRTPRYYGSISAGTRLAYDIARAAGIRCFNLAVHAGEEEFLAYLAAIESDEGPRDVHLNIQRSA